METNLDPMATSYFKVLVAAMIYEDVTPLLKGTSLPSAKRLKALARESIAVWITGRIAKELNLQLELETPELLSLSGYWSYNPETNQFEVRTVSSNKKLPRDPSEFVSITD